MAARRNAGNTDNSGKDSKRGMVPVHSMGFREAARFFALGALVATSANQWVWAKVSPRSQRWGFIATALVTSGATIVTILDIILDP